MEHLQKPIRHPLGALPEEQLRDMVIAARYQERWVYHRRRQRELWELPCGRIRQDETPHQAARRLLLDEIGAVDFSLTPVCCYQLSQYGMVWFAEIKTLGQLPEGEHASLCFVDTPPHALDRPELHTTVYDWVQGWRNMQTSADELWNIYDKDRNLTGRTHRRGDPLSAGEYHLTVHIWLQNSDGRFLITKRAPNKGYAGVWECTGGSALAGDDSLTAALREVREETGLTIRPENGRIVYSYQGWDWFTDVWLFQQALDTSGVVLQPGETCDYRWATATEILEMNKREEMVPYRYLKAFLTGGIEHGKGY